MMASQSNTKKAFLRLSIPLELLMPAAPLLASLAASAAAKAAKKAAAPTDGKQPSEKTTRTQQEPKPDLRIVAGMDDPNSCATSCTQVSWTLATEEGASVEEAILNLNKWIMSNTIMIWLVFIQESLFSKPWKQTLLSINTSLDTALEAVAEARYHIVVDTSKTQYQQAVVSDQCAQPQEELVLPSVGDWKSMPRVWNADTAILVCTYEPSIYMTTLKPLQVDCRTIVDRSSIASSILAQRNGFQSLVPVVLAYLCERSYWLSCGACGVISKKQEGLPKCIQCAPYYPKCIHCELESCFSTHQISNINLKSINDLRRRYINSRLCDDPRILYNCGACGGKRCAKHTQHIYDLREAKRACMDCQKQQALSQGAPHATFEMYQFRTEKEKRGGKRPYHGLFGALRPSRAGFPLTTEDDVEWYSMLTEPNFIDHYAVRDPKTNEIIGSNLRTFGQPLQPAGILPLDAWLQWQQQEQQQLDKIS